MKVNSKFTVTHSCSLFSSRDTLYSSAYASTKDSDNKK